jgi:PhzF family phenazine biosynthesis protein
MRLAFRIVNVFTIDGDRLSGNPLCVFEDGRGLDTAQMLGLARQMNLSETTFVLPSERADAHVRIFTPAYEMPFAGHPTLGTASVVAGDKESVTLELGAGLVPVTRHGERWTLRTAQPPISRPADAGPAELASMLGLEPSAIAGEARWVSTGVEQLVVPLVSSAAVNAAVPVADLLLKWGYSPTRKAAMAYVWSDDGAPERPWVVRFFFSSRGAVIEDPATGSACANLGGYLLETGREAPFEATLRQGDAVARPSRLHLTVDRERAIRVGGAVIELGRGAIDL